MSLSIFSPIKSNHYVISLSDLFGFKAVWTGLYLFVFVCVFVFVFVLVCLQGVYFLRKQQVCVASALPN